MTALALYNECRKILAPPPDLTVSEWADEHRVLTAEGSCSKPGKWKTSFAAYQKEMMDVVTQSAVERVVIRKSSQIGASEILNNICGYYIDQDPSSILMLQPTLDFAEDYAKDRIGPMIAACKTLRKKIPKNREGNTLLYKKYPGGRLVITGANSVVQLASRAIRIVLIDEVDRMKPTTEGDACKLAETRATTFFNHKFIYVSTPTLEGASRIDTFFDTSDQRYFYVPCPYCGTHQHLVWANIEWKKSDGEHYPETAAYNCNECKRLIQQNSRDKMVAKGEWRAHNDFVKTAGFQINELYSPWRKWSETVTDYLDAKKSEETIQVWWNVRMGQSYRTKGAAPKWKSLFARRENYVDPPEGVKLLTMGVDVQDDRLHLEVVGWGARMESWSLAYLQISGDTAKDYVWERLTEEIYRDYAGLSIRRVAIDSGFRAEVVYQYCKQFARNHVIAIKGSDTVNAVVDIPRKVGVRSSGKKKKSGSLKVWMVGVSHCKTELYGFLRKLPGEEGIPYGYCHFPQHTENYFKELTAEVRSKKLVKGFPVYFWEKLPGRANEALDTRVYARAAAHLEGVERLIDTSKPREPQKERPQPVVNPAPPVKQQITRRKSSFWGPRR